jgi:threonine dehydrogenase-like Zn-dependent dehydrogenase
VRAARLSAPRTLELVEIPAPVPGPDDVLVRVEAASICGSDLSAYRGVHPRIKPPTILGHELAGTVVDAGAGVDPAVAGRRVSVEPNICCGKCRYCTAGLPNICPHYRVLGESLDLQGALAELIAVPASQLHVLPASVPARDGAIVQPLAISYEGVVRRGRVSEGERVLIVGAGPIGLGALLLARLAGAQVMIVDVVDHRIEVARGLGAEIAMRADDPGLDATLAEWTDGYGADVAIEAVGGKQTKSLTDAQRLTAPRGRIVVLGAFSDAVLPFAVADLKNREQTMLGSHGHPETFAPVVERVIDGSLRPGALISHVLPLDQVGEAFRMLDEKRDGVVKVVLEP